MANVRWLTNVKLTQTAATTGTSGVTSRTGSNTTNRENSTGQIVPRCTAEVRHFQGLPQKKGCTVQRNGGRRYEPYQPLHLTGNTQALACVHTKIASCYDLRNCLRQQVCKQKTALPNQFLCMKHSYRSMV